MIAFGDRRRRRALGRVIDSLSGLEKRALQEFDGEVRSAGGGWDGPRRRSRAPSTALRAVPLPRCAREEGRGQRPRLQGKLPPLQPGKLAPAALARPDRSDHISALARPPRRDP
jgi:hypothetical protein